MNIFPTFATTFLFEMSFLGHLSDTSKKIILVCLGLWLVAMSLVIWALFFRSSRRHHSHRHHHGHERPSESAPDSESDSSRRRRRKRRRPHRPMNPTLAQTGGLPPVRPEQNSEPPP